MISPSNLKLGPFELLEASNRTGKFFSEALILALTNPQYDIRLFIELQVQYMKIASSEHCSEHVAYINCSECQNKNKEHFVYTACSELGIFMYWTCNSINNLLSYCGLVAARISTSDKDLPYQLMISSFCLLSKNQFYTIESIIFLYIGIGIYTFCVPCLVVSSYILHSNNLNDLISK